MKIVEEILERIVILKPILRVANFRTEMFKFFEPWLRMDKLLHTELVKIK
jgi:hypothetical protein